MCAGSGERVSGLLRRTITCPWCGGTGMVSRERYRRLRSEQRTKRAREALRERAA